MKNDRLRFGIFLAPFHAMATSPTLFFQRDLELIDHLDRLGFDEAWIGEHHSGGYEMIGAPEVFIAAAAERTSRIRLGTGVMWQMLRVEIIGKRRGIVIHGAGQRVMKRIALGNQPAVKVAVGFAAMQPHPLENQRQP